MKYEDFGAALIAATDTAVAHFYDLRQAHPDLAEKIKPLGEAIFAVEALANTSAFGEVKAPLVAEVTPGAVRVRDDQRSSG